MGILKNRMLITCVLSAVILTGCASSGITADEWIIKQYGTTPIIELYCENLDKTVGVYAAGEISREEYISELTSLYETFKEMKEERPEEEIKVGSHTAETKAGEIGYENIWEHLDTLTSSLISDESLLNISQLTYFYMGYQKALEKDFEDYYAAYISVGGTLEEETENAG